MGGKSDECRHFPADKSAGYLQMPLRGKKGFMITINFFTTLRLMLNLREITLDGIQEAPIPVILQNAENIVLAKTGQPFVFKLLDEAGQIKRGTIILINGKNILDTNGLEAIVRDGDTIALFPPGGGG